VTTTCGYVTDGYLPEWAEEDPATTGIPLSRPPIEPAEICQRAPFDGRLLRLAPGG
jgi:hypothetical protein